jgi:hypothetical protein
MALMGDAGAGGLTKKYTLALLQSDLAGTHFFNLDKFYGALFGFRRMTYERLDGDPAVQQMTSADWAQVKAADASYRARIIDFAKAVAQGPTYRGLAGAAAAVVSAGVEIYESWMLYDDQAFTPGGSPVQVGQNTWGDVETLYPTYRDLDGKAYSMIEGGTGGSFTNPSLGPIRNQFTVQPHKNISLEEAYEIKRVLSALKPADQILVVDSGGIEIHSVVPNLKVAADSSYWEVSTSVTPTAETSGVGTPYPVPSDGTPKTLPRPPFSAYQGEQWSYNSDITMVSAYVESNPDIVIASTDFDRQFFRDGSHVDYTPDKAIMSAAQLASGRLASDGIMVASPYSSAGST